MGVATTAGARVYIGTTAANAATDSYTEIGEVVSVGEFGRVYNMINHLPLASRGVKKFKGSYNDGDPVFGLGKDINDDGQAAVIAALASDFDYNFKIVDNDDVAPASATVTITVAEPGVVTWTAHGLPAGSPVIFTTTGALPTGLTAGTTYYVKEALTADTFTVAATVGGAAITTSSTQSGTHTATTAPVGSYQTFKAKVMSWTDGARSADAVISKNMGLAIESGTLAEQVHLP